MRYCECCNNEMEKIGETKNHSIFWCKCGTLLKEKKTQKAYKKSLEWKFPER